MEIVFLNSFKKDLNQINDKKLKEALKHIIFDLKETDTLQSIKGLEKLKGYYSMTYRIKIGDYMLGLYKQDKTVYLARFVSKEDLYKIFPRKKPFEI